MEIKLCDSEVKAASSEDLTVEHWISTESRDRGSDILLADGMQIDGTVVVLKSHGRDPRIGDTPIGKPVWIKPGFNKKGIRGLLAKTQFYPDEIGKDLWKRTTTGFAPYWSVGWNPIEQKFRTEPDGSETRIVESWFLYEYSLVGLGMAQDAVTPDPSKAFPLMQFKVMPSRPQKMTVTIPDSLVKEMITRNVKREINRLKGRVE